MCEICWWSFEKDVMVKRLKKGEGCPKCGYKINK